MGTLKKGDRVDIFEDPVTKLRPEGKARLIRKISELTPTLERWKVIFISDHAICERVISS